MFAGKSVIVLESRCIGAGQTGRTSGMQHFPIPCQGCTLKISAGWSPGGCTYACRHAVMLHRPAMFSSTLLTSDFYQGLAVDPLCLLIALPCLQPMSCAGMMTTCTKLRGTLARRLQGWSRRATRPPLTPLSRCARLVDENLLIAHCSLSQPPTAVPASPCTKAGFCSLYAFGSCSSYSAVMLMPTSKEHSLQECQLLLVSIRRQQSAGRKVHVFLSRVL